MEGAWSHSLMIPAYQGVFFAPFLAGLPFSLSTFVSLKHTRSFTLTIIFYISQPHSF